MIFFRKKTFSTLTLIFLLGFVPLPKEFEIFQLCVKLIIHHLPTAVQNRLPGDLKKSRVQRFDGVVNSQLVLFPLALVQ